MFNYLTCEAVRALNVIPEHALLIDKSTCLLITLSKYSWFQQWEEGRVKHRGEDYEDLKTIIGKKMLQHCIKLYPNIEGKVGDQC